VTLADVAGDEPKSVDSLTCRYSALAREVRTFSTELVSVIEVGVASLQRSEARPGRDEPVVTIGVPRPVARSYPFVAG